MEIEGYKIIKELNRGPITTVFLARQTVLERFVLIKVLNVEWKNEPDLIERFRREAIICARLKHSNIVNIFDVATQGTDLYLVIEYIEGEDLNRFIARYHPLPFEFILYISRELLNGLMYAHSQDIIHRDIKPSNIMISKDGMVKITDFGLAKMKDQPSITVQGGTVGTPAYMSPEQAQGLALDQRTDIFSSGVTFYQLAGGISPFEGENFAESIHRILNHHPPPLTKLRSDIPEWFSELVESMLAKSPAQRPATSKKIAGLGQLRNLSADAEKLIAFTADPREYQSRFIESSPTESTKRPALSLSLLITVVLLGILLFFAGREYYYGSSAEDSQQAASFIQRAPRDTASYGHQPAEEGGRTRHSNAQKISPSPRAGLQPANTRPDFSRQTPGKSTSSSSVKKPISPGEEEIAAPDSIEEIASEMAGGGEKFGKLYVSGSPWAHVYVDGEHRETTPLLELIILEAGNHHLELRNPNFETYEQEIRIRPGKIDSVFANLKPLVGFLRLRVTPWAEIHINGQYIETTPLESPIALPAGKHVITLTNPNFEVWEDSVAILPGEEISKQISLQPLEK